MSDTSESTYAPTFASAIRGLAKEQWFEYEVRRRAGLGIPMTTTPDSWQVWNADPADADFLTPTADDRPTGLPYTKFFPDQAQIQRFITFRPALIVSNNLAHDQRRALVCPLTSKQHHRHGDVAVEATPRRRAGSVLTARLRSVDADLEVPIEDRELLCFNYLIERNYRFLVRQAVSDFLRGKWTAQHVCRPGAIVRLAKNPEYKGLVLATGALFPRDPNSNIALLAMNLSPDETASVRTLNVENDQAAGICVVDWTDAEGTPQTDVFDVLGVMSALCGDAEVVGTTAALEPVQRMLSRFLAEAT